MHRIISKDGTAIAYEQIGVGPAVILIDGALGYRDMMGHRPLAAALAHACSAITYDRRGRGDSTNTHPYAVEREVEDIEALIDAAGGAACLYGHSSGAALALAASVRLGEKVAKLALYEAPYNDDRRAQQDWNAYVKRLDRLLADGHNDDAIALFMELTGAAAADVAGLRQAPFWAGLVAVAPTLAYDHSAILGPYAAVPVELAARAGMPALVLSGADSYPFMLDTARALSRALPRAQLLIMEGQTHEVQPEALAPLLIEFFGS